MQVALLVLEHFVITETMATYDVLHRIPGLEIVLTGLTGEPVASRTGAVTARVDAALDEVRHPDVIVASGGLAALDDERLEAWLRRADATAQWTTSVGVGSLLLARAGILDGVEATTHWAFRDQLAELGAIPVHERVVERGHVITAAGVSASLDLALTLAERIADRDTAAALQLWMEYDPQPPFDSGSVAKADEAVISRASALLRLGGPTPTVPRSRLGDAGT